MSFRFSPISLACAASAVLHGALAQTTQPEAEPLAQLPDVVVTAPRMQQPLVITTDPKAPRQPIPAHDGADYLKTIPGFSVIRKAGTDGDPVLRGMAGSRLGILLDGQHILGGCGGRMDPPTAYVFPEAYDSITVLKGPQSVLYGPGNSAGTVLFERRTERFTQSGSRFNGSLTAGSYDRHDGVVDAATGNPDSYLRGGATTSHSGDYKDGDGRSVHSRYERWSADAALGLTPDDNTLLELSFARSDGKAAYADRAMDGVRFARDNVGFRFSKRHVSALIAKLEAQAYRNYIDHVMDNYSLRPVSGMRMVSNPDRTTSGARVAATLRVTEASQLVVGADLQENEHTLRTTQNQLAQPYQDKPRAEDANFRNAGIFGELTHVLGEGDRIVTGLRADRWQAQDRRAVVALLPNPSAGQTRNDTLGSGFARVEHELGRTPMTVYAGVGHSERFPDYWELIAKESAASVSAFDTRPEKTNQLDVGAIYDSAALHVEVSGFYGKVNDFIQIQSRVTKGARTGIAITRNIDATTWGGEVGATYAVNKVWKLDGSLAWARGSNDTDDTPLAQMPALETRIGLRYDKDAWSFGTLLRLVAEQNRFDLNKGNIVGQDLGRAPGFGVFSVNGGWKPKKGMLVSAGIDNLFDKTYAENLSKAGAMVAGYVQTVRINEPGRTVWVKAQIALD